jgi:hypothetical protein
MGDAFSAQLDPHGESVKAPASATSEEVRKLRMTVLDMDGLAQDGCDRIAAISLLAIDSLESPGAINAITLLHALRAINYTAHDMLNCIGTQAEGVGCGHVDKGAMRVLEKQFPASAAQGATA